MFLVTAAGLKTTARVSIRNRASPTLHSSFGRRSQQQASRQQKTCFSSSSPTPSGVAKRKTESTQNWFERVVIGEKLCPFASPLLKQEGLLRIVSSSATTTQEAIVDVQKEIFRLMEDPEAIHETTLVVLDGDCDSEDKENSTFVNDYMEFVRLSWELQAEAIGETYQGKLQIVLFHPRATHQTYAASMDEDIDDDAAAQEYTIRSPYPTIHLLREDDVLKAVQSGYPDLEYLPSRNKAKLEEQGLDACRKRLQGCYTDKVE